MRFTKWMVALTLGCAPGGGGGGGGSGSDGGADGDGAVASCEDVVCGGTAHCEAGECVCDEGLVREGLDCVDAPLPDMGDRTEQAVCARWAEDHVEVMPEWTPLDPEDPCDPGEVSVDAQRNAVKRTNLYRWLAGLEPVGFARDLSGAVQACAVILDQLGRLDHEPPADTPCYTALGADTAGRSNLASGGTGMAGSLELYISDVGVDSLGHRRWVLSPNLGETAFGFKNRWSCMHVFRMKDAAPVDLVAWPPAGYVPLSAARGVWSVAFPGPREVVAGTRIEVKIDGGPEQAVTFHRIDGGFGSAGPAYGWEMPEAVYRHGTTVEVLVTGLSDGDMSYTLRFTDCGG